MVWKQCLTLIRAFVDKWHVRRKIQLNENQLVVLTYSNQRLALLVTVSRTPY